MSACIGIFRLGHRRRAEAIPLLIEKFKASLAGCYPDDTIDTLVKYFCDHGRLGAMALNEFMALFVTSKYPWLRHR